MLETLKQPWPWYVAGTVIGLIVPALLILGNKPFGISSNLRHICAACFPGNISFFKYNWRKQVWNLFFAAGIIIGAFIATQFLSNPLPIGITPQLDKDLLSHGIKDRSHLTPDDLFSFSALLSLKGVLLMIVGGFLVGFGTRYAGGCTSGHSIMGLSTLQWPSLIATIAFMAGGLIMVNFLMPYILAL